MKTIAMWKNAAMAAVCVCVAGGCAELASVGVLALQAGLSAPSQEEKAAKENPPWVAVAETLTPAQKKAVPMRLEKNKESHLSREDPQAAWEDWKRHKSVKSGDYTPGVHAEVLRVCEEVRQTKVQLCFQWNPPDLEKRWERRLAGADSLSTAPRTEGVDAARGEELLAKFAASRMPKSFARYRAARRKAVELERVLQNDFPQGKESDPSGGEIFERTQKNAAKAISEMFRRHDELCFFVLMRKAGVFSDATLKKYDDQGGAVWLEGGPLPVEEADPGEIPVFKEEDAAFAREHLPESWKAVQALIPLCQTGAAQYRELRNTAHALDAAWTGGTLALFLNRAATIRQALEETFRQCGVFRFQHRIGELDEAALGTKDREISASLQALREEAALGRWISQKAKMGVLSLPGGETMDMVWCPPGSFLMGSPASEKGRKTNEEQCKVTIEKGFWMAKYEVTSGQMMGVLFSKIGGEAQDGAPLKEMKWRIPAFGEVTSRWLDDFCAPSLLELPTPEEWEYACRAGSTGPYGGTGKLDDMGWYMANSHGAILPVGWKSPNAWGFYDMHGNVWEQCAGAGSPIRGGSFRDGPADCRSAAQDSLSVRIQGRARKDVETMLRRMKEEGIDEVDMQRIAQGGVECLPSRKREKIMRLMEEGVIVDPRSSGSAVVENVGFRPVFRPE